MLIDSVLRRAFFAFAALGGGGALAAPPLAALSVLEPGLWQLRGEGEPMRAICIAKPDALFQLRHNGSPCNRLVVADEKSRATVHYSCPGRAGWGRTTVHVETPRLARIETQGIADNAPFAFTVEARRVGACISR